MPPTLTQPTTTTLAGALSPETVLLWRRRCLPVAAVAAVLSIVLAFLNPAAFFRAYLFAAVACLHPALGCLPLTFIHRMTGGAWGVVLAPALGSGRRMIPWTLLFFVPLFFGLRFLFPWVAPETLNEQARTFLAKHPEYFATGAFALRAGAYVVSYFLLLWMAQRGANSPWTGPVGMILYVATTYLLSVDWVMSIQPGWSSTAFPVVFMAGQVLAALAFCIAATILLGVAPGRTERDRPTVWKDLGNLLLGSLMFWAYVAYGEFLIVWSGDAPRESAWYLHRNAGGWHYLIILLALVHLAGPVLLLISNLTKRRTRFFALLAMLLVFGQAVYIYWLILPTYRPTGIGFPGVDALLALALDALWLALFLGGKPLEPIKEEPKRA